ncbi:MAG: sugar phosphate isomerase/epimerase [Dysgonamonadaceae bacterium]|nr:sugar phosphate isomerase/epimerase [Dysgonamonadaceae bacterium]
MKTINAILLVLATATVFPCMAEAAPKKNIGLQMYSLRNNIGRNSENVDSIIIKIGKMGYKYVETANYNEGKIYGLSPEEFKAKLAANKLTALSCHTGRSLAKVVSETNWDETWAWWDKCIASHKAAGMKYIVTPSMPADLSIQDLQTYCDYYNKIGEKCKAAGMRFGYHNHAYEFSTKFDIDGKQVAMYDYMVEHTDKDKVFFEMDVYWVIKGLRTPVELFKKYPGRFDVLHIKDEAELGESGMVGFDAIFKHIGTAGTKYLIVEVENYNFSPEQSVKLSLNYLNKAGFVKKNYSK